MVATAVAAAIVAPVHVVGKIAAMEAVPPVVDTAVVELLAVATSPVLLTEVVLKRVAAVVVVVVLPRPMVVEAVMAVVAMAAAVIAVEMTTAAMAAPKADTPICSVHCLKPGICELPG
ncbi:hypothetical protein MITS9504_02866 [Synechococcus sp. MIT S9504]|nr:hypothetical protein MITS9504_02866 [Synechococcus sp. MIT S9504]